MGDDNGKEAKPQPHQEGGGQRGRRGRRHNNGGQLANPRGDARSYKSSVEGIESDIFDLGASKDNAAQFTRSIKNIANYIHHKYSDSSDIAAAIKTLTKATIPIPSPPVAQKVKQTMKVDIGEGNFRDVEIEIEGKVDDVDLYIWRDAYSAAQKRSRTYEELNKKAYNLIYMQCSPSLRTALEGHSNFFAVQQSMDAVDLLLIIKGFCCKFDTTSQPTMAMVKAFKTLYTFYQKPNMSIDDYKEQMESLISVVEQYGGGTSIIGHVPSLRDKYLKDNNIDAATATPDVLKEANVAVSEAFKASLMLSGASYERYESLRRDLDHSFSKGHDDFPKTVAACVSLLTTWRGPRTSTTPRSLTTPTDTKSDTPTTGAIFAQTPAATPPAAPPREEQIHSQSHAPAPASASSADVHDWLLYENPNDACCFTQAVHRSAVSPHQLLLDSQSTVHQFINPTYLKNIRTADTPITVFCNAGSTTTTHQGDFGSMPVYLNKYGVANVLSLFHLAKNHHITYDSLDRGGVFKVHTPSGNIIEFTPNEKGLHTLDLRDPNAAEFICVTTVRDNFEGFTRREVQQASAARRLSHMIGYPSPRDLAGVVRAKLLDDCPVDHRDVSNALAIFGPDLASVRGKTVRHKPEHVRTDLVEIPRDLVLNNQRVTLVADIMFVNGLAFLVSYSRKIGAFTIEFTPTRTARQLATLVDRVCSHYSRAGFQVQTLIMDGEFEKIRDLLPGVVLNTTAANEHVAEIERRIRTLKERARCALATMPFRRLPNMILIHLLYFLTMWINNFPSKTGISSIYSPRELLNRSRLSASKHCRADFGAYCEVHEEPSPSNTMASRTQPAICLGPTGNAQGSYRFFSLSTGRVIVRRNFTIIPMPDTIIALVDEWAGRNQAQPGLTFTDRTGREYLLNNDLDEPLVQEPEPACFPDIPAILPGIDRAHVPLKEPPIQDSPDASDNYSPEDDAHAALANAGLLDSDSSPTDPIFPDNIIDLTSTSADDNDEHNDYVYIKAEPPIANQPAITGVPLTEPTTTGVPTTKPTTEPTSEPIIPGVPSTTPPLRRSSRPHRPNTRLSEFELYTTIGDLPLDQEPHHMYTNVSGTYTDISLPEDIISAVAHYLMVHYATAPAPKQYSLKKGLKIFGEKGEDAVTREFTQMHMLNVYSPLSASSLSSEDKKKALSSLIFLKEKSDGTIKARKCADGSKQREHYAKEETTSPTVGTDSLFITATINAHEERDVATADLPGAFLHADNDDFTIIRLDGILAELMVKTAPNIYRKYISTDQKGRPVLYLQAQKAIYGMLKSALLFYRKLVADLRSIGFDLNPYDPCVANRNVKGHQQTVIWHVDDLTISHVDYNENTKLIDWLRSVYGKVVFTRGPKHDYLGMQFDYSFPHEVRVNMGRYIGTVLKDFPAAITSTSPSPAADHLFKVRDQSEARLLPESQAVAFHHTVAQLLFMSKCRRDIQLAVAFLTTRVKSPDEDDWGKLVRVLRYLRGTRYLSLSLSTDNLNIIQWYVDASHQIHDNCRGHTGAMMTLGRGAAMSSSNKQKNNTRSSSETELYGLDSKLPDIIWARYFIEAQGYAVESNIVYQDNMSTLSLSKNGRTSSTGRTKHIHAKFFLVKDYYLQRLIDLRYKPTEEMWADILTKPLQGQAFRLMRSHLMNCPIDYDDPDDPATVSPSFSLPTKTQSTATSSPRECIGTRTRTQIRVPAKTPLVLNLDSDSTPSRRPPRTPMSSAE
jgi:hypothetical protein